MRAYLDAEYAELAAATNFSFLRGASHPAEMVEEAIALGHKGLGIADRNSLAGVVRAWRAVQALREAGQAKDFRLLTGARLIFADGTPDIIGAADPIADDRQFARGKGGVPPLCHRSSGGL